MLNQTVLVGKLTKTPEIMENQDGSKFTIITLAVSRSYKNMNGEYETDFIPITLWQGIAEQTTNYCKKGDLVGVRGRLQVREGKVEVVAEKVTFLSSRKENEE